MKTGEKISVGAGVVAAIVAVCTLLWGDGLLKHSDTDITPPVSIEDSLSTSYSISQTDNRLSTENNEPDTTAHLHNGVNTKIIRIEPTCTESGTKTTIVTCECGFEMSSSTEELPALGHDYEAITIESTCVEDGTIQYTCSRCGNTYSETGESALGHDYKQTTTLPTCLEHGFVEYTCSRCQNSYRETYPSLFAMGHNYENGICTQCNRRVHFVRGADVDDMNAIIDLTPFSWEYNSDSFSLSVWEIIGKETSSDGYYFGFGVSPNTEANVSVFLIDYNDGSIVQEKTSRYGITLYFEDVQDGKYYYAVERNGYDSMFYYGPVVFKRNNAESKEKVDLTAYTYTKPMELSFGNPFIIKVVDSYGNGVQLDSIDITATTNGGEEVGGVSWYHCTDSDGIVSVPSSNDGTNNYQKIVFSLLDGYYLRVKDSSGNYVTVTPPYGDDCFVVLY